MAGSWSALTYRQGSLDGNLNKPYGAVKTFTADAADGQVPADELIPGISGWLSGIDVEFGGTAPNSLTIALKSIGGLTLATAVALTASGRVEISPPVPVVGGLKITVTGNTTNSATASIISLIF